MENKFYVSKIFTPENLGINLNGIPVITVDPLRYIEANAIINKLATHIRKGCSFWKRDCYLKLDIYNLKEKKVGIGVIQNQNDISSHQIIALNTALKDYSLEYRLGLISKNCHSFT